MDADLLVTATVVKAWTGELFRFIVDVDERAARLRGAMLEICDVTMPQVRVGPRCRGVY